LPPFGLTRGGPSRRIQAIRSLAALIHESENLWYLPAAISDMTTLNFVKPFEERAKEREEM
jgi:hypothetical protein